MIDSPRRRSARALLGCLAAALAFAGCGGGDSTEDAAVADSATPAPSVAAEPSPTSSSEPAVASPSAKPPAATGPLRVVYTNANGLWSAVLGGGAPKQLDKHTAFDGLAVSPDGKSVAFMPKDAGLYLVDIDGGTPKLLDKDGLGDPVFSPDGKTIAMVHADGEGLNIFSINVDGSDGRKLTTGSEYFVRYEPGGETLLVGGPKSLDRLPASGGTPARLFTTEGNIHALDLSADGRRIAYLLEAELSLAIERDLYVMGANGKNSRRLTRTKDLGFPAWSPDGKSIVFNRGNGDEDLGIWTINPDGTKLHRIATSGGSPTYSPDGRHIVFPDGKGLRVIRADGSGAKTVGKGEIRYFAFVPASG